MKLQKMCNALASLGYETRLRIYRRLVKAGPAGMAAGDIAEALAIQPSNLTFHIAHLRRTGLVRSHRDGRRIVYSVDFAAMGELVGYLTEQCCNGHPEVCRALDATKTMPKTRTR